MSLFDALCFQCTSSLVPCETHVQRVFKGHMFPRQEPKDDAETLAGHGIAVRFSGLGLLAPLHALMLMVPLG